MSELSLGISTVYFFLRYICQRMPRWISVPGLVIGIALVGFAVAPLVVPAKSPLASESLPGFSNILGLKIEDAAGIKRQYLFEYQTAEGSRTSLYFSAAGDRLIFSVGDIRGDSESIDLSIGRKGVPLNKFVFVTCQVGLETTKTYMRVLLNGEEVGSRALPFRMDLGSRQWTTGSLGADSQGRNNSAFESLALAAMGHVTLTDDQLLHLLEDFRTYLRDINSPLVKEL